MMTIYDTFSLNELQQREEYCVNHFNDAFGSRVADAIMNESYYSGIDEYQKQNTKSLTQAEENAIVRRLAELMKGCGEHTNAKKV